MFSKQPLQVGLKLRIFIKDFLLYLLIFSIVTSVVTIITPSTFAITVVGGNKTNGGATTNMTFVGNMMPKQNMTMPGGNMSFGASLQNAKMHLTEAIMDLKIGDTKGAAIELNLTAQGIRMHEQELKIMVMEVKNMMTTIKENGSSNKASKNTTS